MTKEIQLTQGKIALVDDDIYPYISQWKWIAHKRKNTWYAVRNAPRPPGGVLILMHRQIVQPQNGMDVDHINGDGLDNRAENLRECTHSQNIQNSKLRSDNESGYKGVHWDNVKRKWRAGIREKNGKYIHLGYHDDPCEAGRAYDFAAKKLHGTFARLNFPNE